MLSSYETVWLFVFFDLPTENRLQRKTAYKFRKELLKDGFTMMQYSVYIRHCSTRINAETHIGRVREIVPEYGKVSILAVTDKQYGKMLTFYGKARKQNKTPSLFECY